MANDLVAKLGVDATGWDAGFQKARGAMASFAGSVSSMITPMGATLAGIGTAIAGVGGAFALGGKGTVAIHRLGGNTLKRMGTFIRTCLGSAEQGI